MRLAFHGIFSSLAHNFIHNPFFKSNVLNRAFSVMESLSLGFSQTMYDQVHRQHHIGNNDSQDINGNTVDWISTYRNGKTGNMKLLLNTHSCVFLEMIMTRFCKALSD